MRSATAQACANIAFIKYWGNRDEHLRLPANGSISMNLEGLITRTQVSFDKTLDGDTLTLNGEKVSGAAHSRVSVFLDEVRHLAGISHPAETVSENNFPAGAGLASSASAFAALALAASQAAGLDLGEAELSRLARRGSGSACRSVPGGFVEWHPGTSDADSFAVSIAPAEHWDLADCIALVHSGPKPTSSTEGHTLAGTSPLQPARLVDAPRRLDLCREAILRRDFNALAEVVELDSNLMHAVMMTSTPSLFYWQEATLAVMQAVRRGRSEGLPACYTVDAGPNVHVICEADRMEEVTRMLGSIPRVREVRTARVGGPALLTG